MTAAEPELAILPVPTVGLPGAGTLGNKVTWGKDILREQCWCSARAGCFQRRMPDDQVVPCVSVGLVHDAKGSKTVFLSVKGKGNPLGIRDRRQIEKAGLRSQGVAWSIAESKAEGVAESP